MHQIHILCMKHLFSCNALVYRQYHGIITSSLDTKETMRQTATENKRATTQWDLFSQSKKRGAIR